MSQEFSVLNLNEDFEKVLSCEDATRWKLEMPSPLEVLASMSPSSCPEELFQARLLWVSYLI